MTAFAAPALAHAGRLELAFDEDEASLAWDAVRAAGLPAGARLAATGLGLPAWWWKGTGLVEDDASERCLAKAETPIGLVFCVLDPAATRPDPQALAAAALARAPAVDAATLARIQRAREGSDLEGDYPLGAHVTPARHDEVLAGRMRMGPGRVVSWTTIGAGAAPSEFARLQDAVGAYHVAIAQLEDGSRTVGIWTEATHPRVGQATRPALRRLYRQQGQWRHGVKLAPA